MLQMLPKRPIGFYIFIEILPASSEEPILERSRTKLGVIESNTYFPYFSGDNCRFTKGEVLQGCRSTLLVAGAVTNSVFSLFLQK